MSPLGGYRAATLLSAPKHAPLTLHLTADATPRPLTLRLDKRPGESAEHLLLKALLWCCLLPTHPDAQCERDLGLRYTPDVVALGEDGRTPVWWGECGSVKATKKKLTWLAQTPELTDVKLVDFDFLLNKDKVRTPHPGATSLDFTRLSPGSHPAFTWLSPGFHLAFTWPGLPEG